MNKQMQKNGFKNSILRGGVYFSLLAMVLFGQVASASTRFYDQGGTGINYYITHVTYSDAQNFCSSDYHLRLPTQAEILADYNGANYLVEGYYWTSTVSGSGHYIVGTNVGNSIDTADSESSIFVGSLLYLRAVCVYDTEAQQAQVVSSFFSDTNAFDNLSTVTSDTFSSVIPFLYLILGVIIGFYIIEKIIGIIPKNDNDEKYIEMNRKGTAMREKIEKLPE